MSTSKFRIHKDTPVLREGTEEESRVVCAVLRWLEVRAKEVPDEYGADWLENIENDAWHSALLRRLLDGKEPTEKRPPTLHSYPFYPEDCSTEHAEFEEVQVYGYMGLKCTTCGAMKWRSS